MVIMLVVRIAKSGKRMTPLFVHVAAPVNPVNLIPRAMATTPNVLPFASLPMERNANV